MVCVKMTLWPVILLFPFFRAVTATEMDQLHLIVTTIFVCKYLNIIKQKGTSHI